MKGNTEWILFVSGRFGSVDSRGRSALTSLLAAAGIAFGVTALIVILSVMNGFQMGYIDSILEVSSAHVRLTGSREDIERVRDYPGLRSMTVFSESQTLVRGRYGRQSGALLRAVPEDVMETDAGFAKAVEITEGSFSLGSPGTVVLGSELARYLAVSCGDEISIIAMSGDSSTDLFPENATLLVTGIFRTGYYEIDCSFSYVSDKTGASVSGNGGTPLAAVKLDDRERDEQFLSYVRERSPLLGAESWRSYNRAFFGALRVEKNMLLFLVILIFVVVTVNIYNSMRRSVYERREEIAILSSLGCRQNRIRAIFVLNGLSIGLVGALAGLLCGLLLSVRINDAFVVAERIVNGAETFASALFFSKPGQTFSLFNPEYFYMNEVPVRIVFREVLFVFLFGVLSATVASWMASGPVVTLKPAEVLRYE